MGQKPPTMDFIYLFLLFYILIFLGKTLIDPTLLYQLRQKKGGMSNYGISKTSKTGTCFEFADGIVESTVKGEKKEKGIDGSLVG